MREGRTDWYRIENKAASKASVYIYDEIGYVGVSAQDFVRELNEVRASEIELHLDTPGGDVFDGIAIYNAIHDHPARVTVIVDSLAASAGSFIAQAGDHRVMNRGSQMMIHNAHSLMVGNSKDLREHADFLEKQSANIANIYAARSGKDVDGWLAAMDAETWYMAEEAVEAGLADEVAGQAAVKTGNTFDLSVFSHAGREYAPAPVVAEPEATEEIDWAAISNALKGALA